MTQTQHQASSASDTSVSTLVLGTTHGVFVVSADATNRAASLPDRNIFALCRANGSLLAATNQGVYRSLDDGTAWYCAGLAGRKVMAVQASPTDELVLYAGTQPPALYQSRDGGASWSEIEAFTRARGAESWGLPPVARSLGLGNGAAAHTIALDAAQPSRCWVGIEVGGIAVSEDDGRSWVTVVPGGDPDIHVIVSDPARPETLYVSAGHGRLDDEPREQRIAGVFGSEDGGRTWRYRWEGMQRHYTRPLCVDPRPPHALTVGSTPTSAPYLRYRIEGGANGMLYQSTDRGQTWRSLSDAAHSPSVAAPLVVVPAPDHAGSVLVGTDYGEVWEVTPEAQWTLLASGLPPLQAVLPLS